MIPFTSSIRKKSLMKKKKLIRNIIGQLRRKNIIRSTNLTRSLHHMERLLITLVTKPLAIKKLLQVAIKKLLQAPTTTHIIRSKAIKTIMVTIKLDTGMVSTTGMIILLTLTMDIPITLQTVLDNAFKATKLEIANPKLQGMVRILTIMVTGLTMMISIIPFQSIKPFKRTIKASLPVTMRSIDSLVMMVVSGPSTNNITAMIDTILTMTDTMLTMTDTILTLTVTMLTMTATMTMIMAIALTVEVAVVMPGMVAINAIKAKMTLKSSYKMVILNDTAKKLVGTAAVKITILSL